MKTLLQTRNYCKSIKKMPAAIHCHSKQGCAKEKPGVRQNVVKASMNDSDQMRVVLLNCPLHYCCFSTYMRFCANT